MVGAMLLLLPLAHAGGPTGGLYGGFLVTPYDLPPDDDEAPIGSAPTVVGRVGWQVTPAIDVEAEVGFAQGHTTREGEALYDLINPRFHLLYHFTPDATLDAFLLGGIGLDRLNVHLGEAAASEVGNPATDLVIDAGPGVTVALVGPLHLRTDLRVYGQVGMSDGAENFLNAEWTAGFDLRSERPADGDGDAVVDKEDACPDDAEDADGFEDGDGCPDLDNDHDEVGDEVDACPDDPEDPDGFADTDGCPDADNDKDGAADAADRCPDDPEDADGFHDDDGCPDPDDDEDGIVDSHDACPAAAETDNNYQDDDGCPDDVPVEVKRFTGVIAGVEFDTGKATIRPVSFGTLGDALVVLLQYPDVRMEVQGHTDDQGDDAKNLALSQERAQAVVTWLIARGVDPARLIARGYGESMPIDANATALGRQHNRRVEFHLLDR